MLMLIINLIMLDVNIILHLCYVCNYVTTYVYDVLIMQLNQQIDMLDAQLAKQIKDIQMHLTNKNLLLNYIY